MRVVSSKKIGWMARGRTFIAGPFGECGGGCGTRRGFGLRAYFPSYGKTNMLIFRLSGLTTQLSGCKQQWLT